MSDPLDATAESSKGALPKWSQSRFGLKLGKSGKPRQLFHAKYAKDFFVLEPLASVTALREIGSANLDGRVPRSRGVRRISATRPAN
jgi:hypothetical protein